MSILPLTFGGDWGRGSEGRLSWDVFPPTALTLEEEVMEGLESVNPLGSQASLPSQKLKNDPQLTFMLTLSSFPIQLIQNFLSFCF